MDIGVSNIIDAVDATVNGAGILDIVDVLDLTQKSPELAGFSGFFTGTIFHLALDSIQPENICI